MAPETLKAHRPADGPDTVVEVAGVRFGAGGFPVIAGPCAVEGEHQMMTAAEIVREGGASMLRGGAFKPRTSPYSFQGLGAEGLRLLERAGKAAGLPTVTEVLDPADVGLVAEHVDMLQVGARNMQNFRLLQAVGRSERPVLLKRGPAATVEEWLLAAEYVLDQGNPRVVLCERGIRSFETSTRNTLDLASVAVVKALSHLPVVVDPSHAAGRRDLVLPLGLAGLGVGADGLMVEVHPRPDEALSDGPQQLDRDQFLRLMEALGVGRIREAVDQVDRELVRLLARRLELALSIGRVKAGRGQPVRAPEREEEILAGARAEAERLGLDADFAEEVFELVLRHSRSLQEARRQAL